MATSVPIEQPVASVALPHELHQTVEFPASISRVIVVGDLHGCFDELQDLLQHVEYNADHDRVILVGDLVNKGPKSAEVIQFARTSNFLCVRGNQDDTVALRDYYTWKASLEVEPPARNAFLTKLNLDDIAFLEQLPFTISLPQFNVVIVHAGLVPGVALTEQQPLHMYTMRFLGRRHGEEKWVPLSKMPLKDDPEFVEADRWAKKWTGPQHIIFGHDAVAGVQQEPFATGLDSGCCYGKRLTACILPQCELVSVPARQQYTIPNIKPTVK